MESLGRHRRVGTLVRRRMDAWSAARCRLRELGAQLLEQLPLDTSAHTVVLHGDFNAGNVLAAEREPWLAVDAKPMVGDAAGEPNRPDGRVDGLDIAGDITHVGSELNSDRYRCCADDRSRRSSSTSARLFRFEAS